MRIDADLQMAGPVADEPAAPEPAGAPGDEQLGAPLGVIVCVIMAA